MNVVRKFVAILLGVLTLTVVAVSPAAAAAPNPVPAGTVSVVQGTPSHTALVVTWNQPAAGGDDPVTYEITVDTSPTPTSAVTQSIGFGTNTATFSGLNPSTLYVATVVARNADGDAAGESGTGSTATAPTVPGQPSNLSVSAGADPADAVVLSWDAPSANGSPITGYTILGGPAPVSPGAGATNAPIAGLDPSTSYDFTIVATNAIGDSAPAAAFAQITTSAEPAAPGAPGTPSFSETTGSSTKITWTAAAANNSTITLYTITLTPAVGSTVTTTSTGLSATANGLDPAVTYTVTVKATNAVDDGPASGSASVTTDAGAPDAPANVNATSSNSSPNQLTVTWDAPSTNGSAITGYVVSIKKANGSDIVVDPNPGATATSVTITGLTAGSYTAKVIALSGAGNSGAGTSTSTNVVTAPGLVTNIVAKTVDPGNVAVITWDPPADDGGIQILSYTISIAGVSTNVGASQTSATVGPLPAGSYSATINANTAAGAGSKLVSNTINVFSFAPFFSEDGFIQQIYRDFLGREADTDGLNYWKGQNNNDRSSVTSVVIRFMNSDEFAPRRSVARLYLAYFGRDPEIEGFDYWTVAIANGSQSVQSASNFFASGTEFQQKYGALNNRQFVELVYKNVLGRTGETTGVDYWTSQIDAGMTRGVMMTRFSESPENISSTNAEVSVIVTYRGMLNRKPDSAGRAYWVGQVKGDPNALAKLVHGFYHSDEYAARIQP